MIAFSLDVKSDEKENVLARINTPIIDGIWEEGQKIHVFVSAQKREELYNQLSLLSKIYSLEFTDYDVPDANWNEIWESNFQPITVDDKCIVHAPFHRDLAKVDHYICISPKMAFGTGHHETTYMMISEMLNLDISGKKVLDWGMGTGILCFLAGQLGAESILGIDHDHMAVENAYENLLLNRQDSIEFALNTIGNIKNNSFDLILANINRQVLMKDVSKIQNLCHPDTKLLISGLLLEQENDIVLIYEDEGWEVINKRKRGEWVCILFARS